MRINFDVVDDDVEEAVVDDEEDAVVEEILKLQAGKH